MWDVRESCGKPVSKCNIFNGGVTYIMQAQRNNQYIEGYSENHILASSYDERIYVLDKRNLKRSLKESKKMDGNKIKLFVKFLVMDRCKYNNVKKGGVWKMKLHEEKDLLLCACMHTGAHVVDAHSLKSELYYDKHGLDNLVYGCDWKPASMKKQGVDSLNPVATVATCSFYNHSLRVWNLFNK